VHYDQDYVVRVEGHDSLLVQGPLQAVQMFQVLLDVLVDGAAIRTVDYRHLRALHVGEEAVMSGALTGIDEASGSATFELWVQRAADGEPTTTGTASVRSAPAGNVA
jgi:hydroxyacyl-ACP dehydratase HTD2-like protein with hotdog domain